MGIGNAADQGGKGMTGIGGTLDPMYRLFGHHASNAALPMTAAEQLGQDQAGRRYSQGKIQQAYESPEREKQYQDYMAGLRGLYTDQVNQQQQQAARNLKFSDARTGHTGGSAAADAGNLLQRDYQGGLLTAADTARTGTDALVAGDKAAENQAINMSNYGSNVGQNEVAGLGSTTNTINANMKNTTAGSLGDMFSNLGNIYQQRKATAGANYSPYGSTGAPASNW